MKNLILLFTFLCTISYGQTTLEGLVTDKPNGNILLFATVALYQNNTLITGTETNLDGIYQFNNIEPGIYDVEASYVGYNPTRQKNIKVQKGITNILNFSLSEGVFCDEILLIEYRNPLIQHNRKTSNGSVTSKKIRNLPTKSIDDLAKVTADYAGNNSHNRKPQNEIMDNEEYTAFVENRYLTPKEAPLSTFSIDVDRAAYSNIRRYINNGSMPPVDAIRIEEMINYFDYNYEAPKKDPFAIHTQLTQCPWNPTNQVLHIGLQGKKIKLDKLPASNLVFLIDVSGSMNSQNKLPLLKSSFKLLVNQLRKKDKVSIVVYAGAAGLVLEPTNGDNKQKILEALDNLSAGGSTAGGEGIELAYKTAKQYFIKGGNNRIILATDGDFNVGASSNADMEALIEKERKSGVFLSVLGYGMGNYKDGKMEILADKGNGNHAYIDNIQEAKKIFVNEFAGTLFAIAKDVKIQIEFNPNKVQAYRLVGYETRLLNKEDFNDDTKDAGELGAGHVVTAIYEIVPVGTNVNYVGNVDDLKYQKTQAKKYTGNNAEIATLKLRYKKPDGKKSKKIERIVKSKDFIAKIKNDDVNFSLAVAEFGLLLRDSAFKGNASLTDVINRSKEAKGNDKDGYRSEFIRLVESVNEMGSLASQDE